MPEIILLETPGELVDQALLVSDSLIHDFWELIRDPDFPVRVEDEMGDASSEASGASRSTSFACRSYSNWNTTINGQPVGLSVFRWDTTNPHLLEPATVTLRTPYQDQNAGTTEQLSYRIIHYGNGARIRPLGSNHPESVPQLLRRLNMSSRVKLYRHLEEMAATTDCTSQFFSAYYNLRIPARTDSERLNRPLLATMRVTENHTTENGVRMLRQSMNVALDIIIQFTTTVARADGEQPQLERFGFRSAQPELTAMGEHSALSAEDIHRYDRVGRMLVSECTKLTNRASSTLD